MFHLIVRVKFTLEIYSNAIDDNGKKILAHGKKMIFITLLIYESPEGKMCVTHCYLNVPLNNY